MLDQALARGATPETNAAVGLRAQALVARRTRRELGRTLERILVQPSGPSPLGSRLQAPPDRVSAARGDLKLLARRLLDTGPVDARGVARTRVLLSDAGGPLFWHRSREDLRARVQEAIEALEPSG
jgi:hypothetical protein